MRAILDWRDETILNLDGKDMILKDNVTDDDIEIFLLLHDHELGLNEAHSCSIDVDENLIHISGDEDMHTMEIVTLKGIDLF